MRLGDLNALHHELVVEMVKCIRRSEETKGTMAERVLNKVDEAPTIDAEVVVHGQWIPKYEIKEMRYSPDDVENYRVPDGFSCSRCGRVEYHREPYCNCGAKMDGKSCVPREDGE